MAAPRSGSTLLFETLQVCSDFWTIGGESHRLIEGIPGLRPGCPGVDSNRLLARHATPEVTDRILQGIMCKLLNNKAIMYRDSGTSTDVRFLEKTPKNTLRIPFIEKIFPDALYIYLYRNPRENIGSIIDAWKAGTWITYPRLPGWNKPWSLLLPPGWQHMRGKDLHEIAAFQWNSANRFILEDLSEIPPHRWIMVNYADLIAKPSDVIEGLCSFCNVEFDDDVKYRISGSLPLSCYTLDPPAPDKWRKYDKIITAVLPNVMPTYERIIAAAKTHTE